MLSAHRAQGNYYFYTKLDSSDKYKDQLTTDATFGIPYKDFFSGPLSTGITNGTWAVDSVTGGGHVSDPVMVTVRHI